VFLAGLFDDLATWWTGLSPSAKALVVAGAVAALLLLGAGFIGVAAWARFGISIATRMMLRGGLRGRAGYAIGRYLSQFPSRALRFPTGQLQHAFSRGHAADFGMKGTWNKATGEEFRQALAAHTRDRGTLVIEGTYRREQVTHFFNPRTGLNVFRDADGSFWSGWRLNAKQTVHLLRTGSLGGG
jgi:Colicin D